MPTPVSLSEVLGALGGPLEERPLWAVLHQAAIVLREHVHGKSTCELPHVASHAAMASFALGSGGPSLLITPETLLLQRGGTVQLLQGIPGTSGHRQ